MATNMNIGNSENPVKLIVEDELNIVGKTVFDGSIVLSSAVYGTELPTDFVEEGRIFFITVEDY